MCYSSASPASGDAVSVTHEERRVLSRLIESTLAWSELPLYEHEGKTLRGFLEKVRQGKEETINNPENRPFPGGVPELTIEEFGMLADILCKINRNMEPYLTTCFIWSPCTFIFNREEGTDELFRGMYRKVCEIARHTTTPGREAAV
ncbi:MAG TPA: hypothetical protein PKY31_01925 [Spirochaetota bacterium]|nr:hypothetical protein [Spirochaetota bacterium]